MNATAVDSRAVNTHATVDVAVVGGGIVGLAVARLSACQGFRTALFERADFGAGASAATSHMLHGGLRYLEHGDIALVREALHERAVVHRMAPAQSRPVRFLVPLARGARVSPWRLRAGLALYDVLAGRARLSPHGWLTPREALALEPALERRGLVAAGRYADVVMDDAALALAVARDAAARGAVLHTWTEVEGLSPAEGGLVTVRARDRLTRAEQTCEARVVVNAAGAWADAVRARLLATLAPASPPPRPLLRPSRGVHLVYPPLTRAGGLLLLAASDGRPFFVVPFPDHTLVGTTEIETGSPPAAGETRATLAEVRYLVREVARALPGAAGAEPVALTAGVRPLLGAGGEVGAASREHRVVVDAPLVTIAGGKFTTFRVMARDALLAVTALLGRQGAPIDDPQSPLPAPPIADTPEALARVAVDALFARRLEDVVRRRSALWRQPRRARAMLPALAQAMAHALGWDAARTRAELARCAMRSAEDRGLIARALDAEWRGVRHARPPRHEPDDAPPATEPIVADAAPRATGSDGA